MSAGKKATATDQPGTSAPVISRLTWIFLGPLTLMLLLMGIASNSSGWYSGLNVTFFVVLGIVILARWKEQRSGSATTVYGDPSTSQHFRRYLLVTIPVALAAWLIANIIGIRN